MPCDLERLKEALSERYVFEGEVGRGGMARVFRAAEPKHNRQVAIKVLRPELGMEPGGDRFLREIETLAKLNHPHILPLFDSGQAGDCLYFVMPYVEGESLRERLERDGPLPVQDAVRLAEQIALALDYAHDQRVIHRDIKPENVVLSAGQAVVADFGVAYALSSTHDRLTSDDVIIGTPRYLSPEQISGEEVDGRSDIYALGCLLYEMLVGEAPYTGAPQAVIANHLGAPIPRPADRRRSIPEGLNQVVIKAMAKRPARRFFTGAEFAESLTASLTHPSRPPGVLGKVFSTTATAVGVGLILVLLLGGGLIAASVGGGPAGSEGWFRSYALSWLAVMLGVWFLFEKAEETFGASARAAVTRWLRKLDAPGAVQTWPATFAHTFDRVFGERHLSWRCFSRSVVVSVAAVILVALLLEALTGRGGAYLAREEWDEVIVVLAFFFVLVNIPADYVSLLETRWLIGWMESTGSSARRVALLAVDLLATTAIWVCLAAIPAAIVSAGEGEGGFLQLLLRPFTNLGYVLRTLTDPTRFDHPSAVVRPLFFYSSLFTSVWLWLYVLSGIAVRLAKGFGAGVSAAQKILDIDTRPIRSLGFVAMLIVTLVFLLAMPFAVP